MVQVIAIAGSPSFPSRSHSVLEYARSILAEQQVSLEILSVRELPAEAILQAQFGNAAIQEATTKVTQADAIIVATPVYKAAYTGVLKAFLDLLPQDGLRNKLVLPIATGGTIAHLLSIDYALKPVLNALGARHILGGVYLVDQQILKQEDGSIKLEDEIDQRLRHSLLEFAQLLNNNVATLTPV